MKIATTKRIIMKEKMEKIEMTLKIGQTVS